MTSVVQSGPNDATWTWTCDTGHTTHTKQYNAKQRHGVALLSRMESDIIWNSVLPTVILHFAKCNNVCFIQIPCYFWGILYFVSARNSSVGIETRYGLNGPGIESRWSEIFRTRPDLHYVPPSLLYNGYRVSFPGVKRPERDVNLHSPLAPRLKKEYSCTSSPRLSLHGLLQGELYLFLLNSVAR